jgi:hypothetical protein
VVPAALEAGGLDPDELALPPAALGLAFAKMNDAPVLLLDDAAPPAAPLVPVVAPAPPRWRHPVTVIELSLPAARVWLDDVAPVCDPGACVEGELLVPACAARATPKPTTIDNNAPVRSRFIVVSSMLIDSKRPLFAIQQPLVDE